LNRTLPTKDPIPDHDRQDGGDPIAERPCQDRIVLDANRFQDRQRKQPSAECGDPDFV
jgi:hypothetical protein